MSLFQNIINHLSGTKPATKPQKQPSIVDPWVKTEAILLKIFNDIPGQHWTTLYRKRCRLVIKDDYGAVDDSAWQKEKIRYIDTHIFPRLDRAMICAIVSWCRSLTIDTYHCDERELLLLTMSPIIEDHLNRNDKLLAGETSVSAQTPRPINPLEYEHYCGDLFRQSGWEVIVTQASGDQGADIRASQASISIVAQCKLYSTPVGNKAVQEVFSSQRYYGAQFGVVITNSDYTKSAKRLAASNGVILLHDTFIPQLFSQLSSRT